MKVDYLIVGSGLSALVFGALMANSGKTVQILEAHEYPGGFGHTFTMAKKYKFNAQFHYVWDCGPGQLVDRVLKKLDLNKDATYEFKYVIDGEFVNEPEADSFIWNDFAGAENSVLSI